MRSKWELLLGALSIIGIAIVLVVFSRAEESVQNVTPTMTFRTQTTATPQPSRTTEPGYTTTPAPDFAAIQRDIDKQTAELNAQRAAFEADIEQRIREATDEKALEELNQLRRMNDAEYAAALENLEHQRAMNAAEADVQSTLSTGILAKQQALDNLEIAAADKLAAIKVIFNTFWRMLVVLAVFAFIVALFIVATRPDKPEQEDTKVIKLEMKQDNRTRFADLPVKEADFRRWARAVVDGVGLSYDQWVTTTKVFTRTDYDKLTDLMMSMGVIEYKHGQVNQGQVGTEAGIASLKEWLEKGE